MVYSVGPPRPGTEGGKEWMRSIREEVKAIRRDVRQPYPQTAIPTSSMAAIHRMPPQGSTIVSPNITFIDSPRGSHASASQKAAQQAEKQQQHSNLISRIAELEKLVKSVADTVKREESIDDIPVPPFEQALLEAVKSLERERREAIAAGDVGLTNKIEANIAALKQNINGTQQHQQHRIPQHSWDPSTPTPIADDLPFRDTQHQHRSQFMQSLPPPPVRIPEQRISHIPHGDVMQISPPRTRTAPTAEQFIAAEGGEVFSSAQSQVTATPAGILPTGGRFTTNGFVDNSQEVLTVNAAQRLLDSVEQVALRKGVTLTTTTTTLTASPQQHGTQQALTAHDSRQVLTPSKEPSRGAQTVITSGTGPPPPPPPPHVIALGGQTTINISDSTTASSSEMYDTAGSASDEEEDIRTSTHRSEKSRSLNKNASRQSIRSVRSNRSQALQSKSSAAGGMDQTFAQVQKQLAAAAKAKARRKSRG